MFKHKTLKYFNLVSKKHSRPSLMFFCPQERDSTIVLHRIGETVIINRKKQWNSWNAIEVYVYSYVGTRQLFLVGITLLHVATWTQGVSALDFAIFKASASLSFSSNWKKTCRGKSACFMLAREVHHVCPHPLAQMSHMSTSNSKEAGEYTDTPHFIMLHPLYSENIVFFANWRFMATLHQATLAAPFPQ